MLRLKVSVHGQRVDLVFELCQPLGLVAERSGQLAQPHEGAHHVDSTTTAGGLLRMVVAVSAPCSVNARGR